jgi:hypothetical protein
MVALVIVSVGMIGAYGLVNQSLALSNSSTNRFTAVHLAAEGAEIARNLRDTNYLNFYQGLGNWSDGLTGYESGGAADYLSAGLTADPAAPLKIGGGVYGYSGGEGTENTMFKRRIKVIPNASPADYFDVVSEVSWSDSAGQHTETVRERLYNWWQ